MQESTFTTRLRIGIASLAALVALVSMAAFTGVAKAGAPAFDPETTNIPYLAWRGTEQRLVKCFAPGHPGAGAFAATFIVELWSGDPHERPQFAAASYEGAESGDSTTHEGFEGTGEQEGLNCFATDIVSQKPGLAMVKMKATTGAPGVATRVVAEHQFLVAWMDINSAQMRDIGLTTSTAGQTAPVGGQPSGGGINQAQVLVTGRIVMMGNLGDELNAGMGRAAGTPLVMPNDWPVLARRFARTAIPGHERNANTWDIHDEFTPGLASPPGAGQTATQHLGNHQVGGDCAGTSTTIDVVDNCIGGGEFGPFSRFVWSFGAGTPDMTVSTVGPFDPKRPGHFGPPGFMSGGSYLPDGVLDLGDAPMPAIRVDYHLAGAGQFVPVDKHNVYQAVLGGESPDTSAHNLYGPFYGAFIPATAAERGATQTTGGAFSHIQPTTGIAFIGGPRPVTPAIPPTTASGTDTGAPNNFTGYTVSGLYHFWDFAVAIGRTGAAVNCPPFVGGDFGATDPNLRPPAATLPSGHNEVQVYTDEHGEARVGFLPGIGFNFPALATVNLNRGCDIQGVGTLGTATITADVRYPAQPVTAPDVGVGTITKTITSLFNKQIACIPKGPGIFNAVTFVCTATAIGITGTPFVNETVCFATNAERISPISSAPVPDPRGGVGPAVLCLRTNAQGQATVEIFGKGTLNVIADFVEENLIRFIQLAGVPIAPGTGGSGQPGTGTAGGAGTGTTAGQAGVQTSATAPTTAQVVSLGAQSRVNAPTTIRVRAAATLQSARIVDTKSGRKLVVKLRSAKRTAKIRVTLRANTGAKIAAAVRRVRTNRAVVVPNLRITARTARVSVSVIS